MKTLKLGATDRGQVPTNPSEFLAPYHPFMTEAMNAAFSRVCTHR